MPRKSLPPSMPLPRHPLGNCAHCGVSNSDGGAPDHVLATIAACPSPQHDAFRIAQRAGGLWPAGRPVGTQVPA